MIRKINDKKSDYRQYDYYENDEYIFLQLEYGESADGLRFYVKNSQLEVKKEGKTTYPEFQELVDQKLKEFENGSLLD